LRTIALKVLPIVAALAWTAIACATPAGTGGAAAPESTPVIASSVLPSIEILPQQSNLAGTCGGGAFDVNTYINVDTQASAEVKLSASSVGTIEEFTDETGSNIGPYTGVYPNFHILAFGGGLAPNTQVQLVITTYTGHALSGSVSYTSSMLFNCTTGVISNIAADPPSVPPSIPALSDAALASLAGVLALLGMLALRRRALRR